MLGAFVGDRLVGSASAYEFEMTLPGRSTPVVPGVTGVAVTTTHRRQGVLSALMRHQLDDLARAGEPVAVLTASETGIYRRFGYGLASSLMTFEVATSRSDFVEPVSVPGHLEIISQDEARTVVPDVYDRYRRGRVGMFSRSTEWWAVLLGDRESWKGGGTFFVLVHVGPDGEADGYAFYDVVQEIEHGLWHGRVNVRELLADSPEIEAALWRHCLDVDLCTELVGLHRPVDEPLRWRLAAPRELRTAGVADMLWLRLVDVAGALRGRAYADDGVVVLDVRDPFLPHNDGRYRLEIRSGEASCEQADAEPDLVLDVDALGAAYLGGVDFTTLARAGRVEARDPAALPAADGLFATEAPPYNNTPF
jgi:predicted acetyltransferase